ncbi:MAG: hypothetical protein ACRCZI_06385 [Cetobacterium sp.]
MYEIIVERNGEEYSYGEFNSKRRAESFLEDLYETKQIEDDAEAWIEKYR